MSFRRHLFLFPALFLALALPALAQDSVTNAVTGAGKSSVKSTGSITIQGEDIFVDGVLQQEKYRPGMDVILRNGAAAVVPHDPARDTRKAEDKAQREREKALARAQRERDRDAAADQRELARDKAEAAREQARERSQQERELGRERAEQEKAAARGDAPAKTRYKTSVGTVVNKGGTVRIGDTVYTDDTPATEKDIPPDARKLLEDTGRPVR